MNFDDIQSLIDSELQQVNQQIHQQLTSSIPLAEEIAEYIVSSGGKRIRPILVLLSAKTFAYQGNEHILLAAIVELLHTATLLHDDVIDQSEMRRGNKTANAQWGNQASVLVGDLLHARSFQMIASLQQPAIIRLLAAATSIIVEGELLQLTHCHQPDTSEQIYLEIISNKTGKLFELSTHLGAVLCQQPNPHCHAMASYGRHLGAAFQLIDDMLDYSGDPSKTGKNIGDDLAEGKPSLPLIYILQHGNSEQKQTVKTALLNSNQADIQCIQQAIAETKALDYTRQHAERFIKQAKESLAPINDSPARQALLSLAQFALERQQ